MSNFPLQTLLAALALSLVAPAVRGDDPFPDQIPARERTEKRLQAVLGLAVELLPDGKGMKITAVADDGPAADVRHPTDPTRRAKMEEGEVIVAIDGQRIRTKRDWYDLLNESRLKNKGMVRLTVEFGPARHTAEILIKPNMVEKEIPVATGIRRPRITPIEDPMLPDLLPAPKK